MNLLIRDINDYITQQWNEIINAKNGSKEARFIIESQTPDNTFQLFALLEEHYQKQLQTQPTLKRHFKVATGLWKDWLNKYSLDELVAKMQALHAVNDDGSFKWIDEHDRLTYYRNLTKPEGDDGLVIILLGLSHTTDQGGLNEFHRINEDRIWTYMGKSVRTWIEQVIDTTNLETNEKEKDQFEASIEELFNVKSRDLVKLSDYFATHLLPKAISCDSLADLRDCFYQNLPEWGIPPINQLPTDKRGKKDIGLIVAADDFISHKDLKTPAKQKPVWTKIEKMLAEDNEEFELPTLYPSAPDTLKPYDSLEDYKETLHKFVHNSDPEAKERLLYSDISLLAQALRKPKDRVKPPAKTKVHPVQGSSAEALFEALWLSFKHFVDKENPYTKLEYLEAVHIEITEFHHDIENDEESSSDKDELAQELLHGCLSGVSQWIEHYTDIVLPADEDELHQPASDWNNRVTLTMNLDLEHIHFKVKRGNPYIGFQITLLNSDSDNEDNASSLFKFKWPFPSTHAERVRYHYAKTLLEKWQNSNHNQILPALKLPYNAMTALYYATDESEANRLLSDALSGIELYDLVAKDNTGLDEQSLSFELQEALTALIKHYRNWLTDYVQQGYFAATNNHYTHIEAAYTELKTKALDRQLSGSKEILKSFYKAFLLIAENCEAKDAYIESAVVTGIHPAVLEMTNAKERFLCDSFPDVVADLIKDRDAEKSFKRMMSLTELHRPLAGLIINDNSRELSAKIKSFNLTHYLGQEPEAEKSLAIQALLKEREDSDDEIKDIKRLSDDGQVITSVIDKYLELHNFAHDGLRILALHVKELPTVLSGIDHFLRTYLKSNSDSLPAFNCEVMIYSTSSSPMAVERILTSWRDELREEFAEKSRPLNLSVGHRFTNDASTAEKLLKEELYLYDIAFITRFLGEQLSGQVQQTNEFEYNYSSLSKFPICEYPLPIQLNEPYKRRNLLSSRRLRIQSSHADMSARLRNNDNNQQFLIYGEVNYEPWEKLLENMHAKSQWVVCIDPFIDKRLLAVKDDNNQRKIVGFSSGLGAYGELNLCISTEQDTLTHLANLVRKDMQSLLPFQNAASFEAIASTVVQEAEEVIGLASLRALFGDGEQTREVLGFAAIHRALAKPDNASMCQLLPLDTFKIWFEDREQAHRQYPDLLQLSFIVREDNIPLIKAVAVECKLAQHNETHIQRATQQVSDGLSHLTQLFAPQHEHIRRVGFDRRYWWAQLQRAITSRAVVTLSEADQATLDLALEQVVEGRYEIEWQGAIFTFWTDQSGTELVKQHIPLERDYFYSPCQLPHDLNIEHFSFGHEALTQLLQDNQKKGCAVVNTAAIIVSPEDLTPKAVLPEIVAPVAIAPAIQTDSNDSSNTVDITPDIQETVETIDDSGDSGDSGDSDIANTVTSTPTSSTAIPSQLDIPFEAPAVVSTPSETAATHEPFVEPSNSIENPSIAITPVSFSNNNETSAVLIEPTEQVIQPTDISGFETATTIIEPTPPIKPTNPSSRITTEASHTTIVESLPPPIPISSKKNKPIVDKIKIGSDPHGEPVYWHYGSSSLSNRHILIFGDSGHGKTYAIQCLLAEMAAQKQSSLIIDYTDGFLSTQVEPRFKEIANPEEHFVYDTGLPLNPFAAQTRYIPGRPEITENEFQIATRISSIFNSVYSMGDQQHAALVKAIENGLLDDPNFNLSGLIPRLEAEGKNGESLARKIEPFIRQEPFRSGDDMSWSKILSSTEHWVSTMQLVTLSKENQRLVTEFLLWDLYSYAQRNNTKDSPIPVVLDEIQNLNHSSDSPIDKMIREGRKFGLSLFLATQDVEQFTQEERTRLFITGHQLVFRPPDTGINNLAQVLSNSTPGFSKDEWKDRLAKLEKGQCWSIGQVKLSSGKMKHKAVLVNVDAFEKRRFNPSL